MRRFIAIAAASLAAFGIASAPSQAAEVCVDVDINIQGADPIAHHDCYSEADLPAAPTAP